MLFFSRWKMIAIIFVAFLGILYSLPNFLSPQMQEKWEQSLPGFMPSKTINLGLDLRGGSQILLEVGTKTVIDERYQSLMLSLKKEFRKNRISHKSMRLVKSEDQNQIQFTLRDLKEKDQAYKIIRNAESDIAISTDGPEITIAFTPSALKAREDMIMDQSIEVVRRRVDESGTKEPSIRRQGADRILLQLPGLEDPNEVKKLLGKTAKLHFHLVDVEATENAFKTGRVPRDRIVLPLQENPARKLVLHKEAIITGDMLIDSQPGFYENQPVVNFRFDSIGAKRFAETTAQNVGRPFAIVLDDSIISAPNISVPILTGSGFIQGSFTVQSANDLALLLRSGSLPAPITVVEERTIGPGLGADSISAGAISFMVGLGLVVVFMTISYGFFGILANIALFFNMSLILAALSGFQATLTLPGIAGIILTIGMAVDANVLIFERIREEMRHGQKPLGAIEAGYGRALTAIVDSNLTTLIAGFLLVWFGSGPVKGFAVTLCIGIITSMFSALMLTRLMISLWYMKKRPQTLPI